MIISCMVGMSVTASAEPAAIGNSGLTWELSNGTLTISGTGAISDYANANNRPWHNNISDITSVNIGEGVISIGRNAFCNCTNLASVTIPSSVISIGRFAFGGCQKLESVTIPSSVTSIGETAFQNCSELATVTFEPRSAEAITTNPTLTIGNNAFDSTKKGAVVAYGTGDTVLNDGTTDIKAENLLKTIYSTSADKTLTWKASSSTTEWVSGDCLVKLDGTTITVTKKEGSGDGKMADYATTSDRPWDNNSSNITSVNIGEGVTSIGQGAFINCTSLTSVTIPSSVTSIGQGAFNFCESLTSVTFEPRSTEDINNNNNSLSIGEYAFLGTAEGAKVAYGLGASILYDNETKIEKDSALTGISDKNLTWTVDNSVKAWTNGNVIGVLEEEGGVKKLIVGKKAGATTEEWGTGWTPLSPNTDTWDTVRGKITEVEIQDSVKSIGDSAFEFCSKLASVSIPGSVTSIGNGAFWGCSKLASVTIPDSVTSIGMAAFSGCSKLASVTILSSVPFIGSNAFQNCTELTSVTFTPGTAGSQLGISTGAFYGAEGAKVAYGTGDTVLFDGDTEIKAGTTLTELTKTQSKVLTWKAKPAPEPAPVVITKYNITMINTCKAYVNDKEVTEAEEGTEVTIKAEPAVSGTEFNGWTTTTEGVVFADADSATTTFTMPAADVEITASYHATNADPVDPDKTPDKTRDTTPFMPTFIPTTGTTTTTTTPTVDITKYNITGKQDEQNESSLKWDAIPDASAYSLYIKVGDKYVFVQDLGNVTNADVVRATNGKYYVSTGGDYTIYEYDSKKGTFNRAGTLESDKIDKVKKANSVTEDFMVKYTVNGTESTEINSYETSVKIYYKPALSITAGKGSIRVNWAKVPGAVKYRVYKVVNDKLKFIIETDKHALLVNGTKAGREYAYAVKAFVDGEWTEVYRSDVVRVTAK